MLFFFELKKQKDLDQKLLKEGRIKSMLGDILQRKKKEGGAK